MMHAIPGFAIAAITVMQMCFIGGLVYRGVCNRTELKSSGVVNNTPASWATWGFVLLSLALWVAGLVMHSGNPHISNSSWAVMSLAVPDVLTAAVVLSVGLLVPFSTRLADAMTKKQPKSGDSCGDN